MTTTWERHAIWWQVYPLGALGAEATSDRAPRAVQHRLPRLVRWLDHAVRLGASGVALGPVFASESHGYDTTDPFRIDPRLGDDADFDDLVRAAHDRGLRLLLDGVFNHVGRSFGPFRAALDGGPGSPEAGWFRLHWRADGSAGEPDVFEGHTGLVALNHDHPAVVDHVARVMNHWLDRGADGWRLDAAYAVPTRFWSEVLPRVRQRHADCYVVGEVIHGDYRRIVAESGMDAVTQYELWKAIWSSLNDRNLFELAWAMERHDELLADFVPLTFLGNHDVTRIASRLTDPRHLPHALAVLMTVAGTPSVYYGDELGWRAVKEERLGGDDAIRPALPELPDEPAPDSAAVLALHQELIGLRRRHDWLHRARARVVHLQNRSMVYASEAEGRTVLTALNLDDASGVLPAPDAVSVLAGTAVVAGVGASAAVELGPHGWAVLGAGRPP